MEIWLPKVVKSSRGKLGKVVGYAPQYIIGKATHIIKLPAALSDSEPSRATGRKVAGKVFLIINFSPLPSSPKF